MAEINNPQLIAFCNEILRPFSNALQHMLNTLNAQNEEYEAKNLGTVIDSAGASNLISDGSATDGRTRVVGGDVYNLITLNNDLLTFLQANGRPDVIAKWSTLRE